MLLLAFVCSHPLPLHPLPSHPLPSHPIPSHLVSSNRFTSCLATILDFSVQQYFFEFEFTFGQDVKIAPLLLTVAALQVYPDRLLPKKSILRKGENLAGTDMVSCCLVDPAAKNQLDQFLFRGRTGYHSLRLPAVRLRSSLPGPCCDPSVR